MWLLNAVTLVLSPQRVYDVICRAMSHIYTEPLDCARASIQEIIEEVRPRCIALGLRICDILDLPTGRAMHFERLLNDRELQALNYYIEEWASRYGTNPAMSRSCAFFLGDNPWSRLTWSATTSTLPATRRNSGNGPVCKLPHPHDNALQDTLCKHT